MQKNVLMDADRRSLVQALQRDVQTYIRELDQRITQLEQSATRAQQSSQNSKAPSLESSKQQLAEIQEVADFWQSGQIDKEADAIEQQINSFLNTQLPAAIDPFSANLNEWKAQFNRQMSSVGRTYQRLADQLNIDTEDLEIAAKTYHDQKRALATLSHEIAEINESTEALKNDTLALIQNQQKELEVSLSGVSQQLQVDLMRVKATTNSTLAQSLANCNSSTLSDLFAALQADVNTQCLQMENGLKDVQTQLDKCEQQWVIDLENIESEMQMEIDSMRRTVGGGYDLQKKLEEAQKKADDVEKLFKSL